MKPPFQPADAGEATGGALPRPLLLCLSHLRWDFVFQRPQHLMSRAARHWDVLFFEEPVVEPVGAPELRRMPGALGVIRAVPVLPEGLSPEQTAQAQRSLLDAELARLGPRQRLLWYCTPMALTFSRHLHGDLCVYDNMDELSNFKGAPTALRELETEMFRRCDLVFTGGQSLYEAKRHRHRSVHAFPSSVDAAHFARARRGLADPDDQCAIARPRLGFFGVIDERLDTALVQGIADLRPDWQLVMLGPLAKIDAADLPQRPNLHWLGRQAYDALPAYLAHWDVGIMPFAINDATRYISPTKTPEFLAAGVPLVSTPIRDVVAPYGDKGLVEIASDAAGFVERAQALMARPRAAWLARVDEQLARSSWDSTWTAMSELIEAGLARACVPATRPVRSGRAARADWLIVGAGFAGSTLAERIASVRNERVWLIDRRPHVGGNAYDELDAAGVLIHRYGPHIFHTNSAAIFEHLSRFTRWRPYEHRVLAQVDGLRVPIPINLDTINRLYGLALDPAGLKRWFAERAEPRTVVNSEDVVVSQVGRELYEKFFRGYTRKQWGLDPSQLDKAVTARVPVRTDRDDRYFTDTYQFMPADGYSAMFRRMLDHPNIELGLGLDHREISGAERPMRVIYTGPVDEYFEYRYGRLPYRSLRFDHHTLDHEWHQPVAVVNYPQTEAYTRVTEYKHLTGQRHPRTSITYEYPSGEGDPYYPIPNEANAQLYRRYEALAEATPDTWFVGRLATYRYYNMDQVVGQALATFRRLQETVPLAGGRTSAAVSAA